MLIDIVKYIDVENISSSIDDDFAKNILNRYYSSFKPKGYIYIIYINNELIGFFIIRTDNSMAGFFIKKEYRNKGYGTKLLNYVIKDNINRPLFGYVSNQSINIFIKFGFDILYKINDHYIIINKYVDDATIKFIKNRYNIQ